MKESFLDRAKADGKVFVKTVSLLSKLSKLKVDIVTNQRERKHVLGLIGTAVYEVYRGSNSADSAAILSAVSKHFDSLRRLDAEIVRLEAEVQQTKAGFKQTEQTGAQASSDEGG